MNTSEMPDKCAAPLWWASISSLCLMAAGLLMTAACSKQAAPTAQAPASQEAGRPAQAPLPPAVQAPSAPQSTGAESAGVLLDVLGVEATLGRPAPGFRERYICARNAGAINIAAYECAHSSGEFKAYFDDLDRLTEVEFSQKTRTDDELFDLSVKYNDGVLGPALEKGEDGVDCPGHWSIHRVGALALRRYSMSGCYGDEDARRTVSYALKDLPEGDPGKAGENKSGAGLSAVAAAPAGIPAQPAVFAPFFEALRRAIAAKDIQAAAANCTLPLKEEVPEPDEPSGRAYYLIWPGEFQRRWLEILGPLEGSPMPPVNRNRALLSVSVPGKPSPYRYTFKLDPVLGWKLDVVSLQ